MAELASSGVVVIIGSGIAAAIASRIGAAVGTTAFSASPPTGALDGHHAVMRLREPSTAMVLGCQAREVIAHRMALCQGRLIDWPDLMANNEYSLKVYGELRECSVLHLGRVKRYLIHQSVQPQSCVFNQRLVSICTDSRILIFLDAITGMTTEVPYGWCISTIPMPVMVKLIGLTTTADFRFRAIGVRKYQVGVDSSVCQTLYVPGAEFKTYRMSLQDRILMVEYIDPVASAQVIDGEVRVLSAHIGLKGSQLDCVGDYTQPYGKIIPVPDIERKRIMYHLTAEAGILSLGRYAVWKSLRADDVVQDARRAFGIIAIRGDQERLYQLSKEVLL